MSIVLAALPWLGACLAAVVVFFLWPLVARIFGVVLVPRDRVGIVTKKFSMKGKSLPDGSLIATNAEAGIQADTLAPGLHLWMWPWQYQIDLVPWVNIEEGQLGVIEARDGQQVSTDRVFARAVDCDSFQNAAQFLQNGGQRGQQIAILRPGTYRINTMLFEVSTAPATRVASGMVGLVTTYDGKPLPNGEIAGAEVMGHHAFQDGQAFINAGGFKGRQEQMILAGTYYLHPRFVSVEQIEMVSVAIGYVGVVNSFVGAQPSEIGDGVHATIVKVGERGVWDRPLDPGKHAINPYTARVEMVPTTNIVLNWADYKSESHNLDRSLSPITVRSADGFSYNLDVAQIIHISPKDAPVVISRFGSILNMVEQNLAPLIQNYFRNSAQTADAITYLKTRSQQQEAAKTEINQQLQGYFIQPVDTLIGDIHAPEALMETLTNRKVAQQRAETFKEQQIAEEARQSLEEAKSMADTMTRVITARRDVEVATQTASATVATARGEADASIIRADAEARVLTTVGEATATRERAVGNAQADVLQKKVEAVGAENYAAMAIATSLSDHGIAVVPQVLVTGKDGGGSGVGEALLGRLVAKDVAQATP